MAHRKVKWLTIFSMVFLSAFLLVGCAGPKNAGFDEVGRLTRIRTGAEIHWYQNGKEDRAVADRVAALMSHPIGPDQAVQIALLSNPRLQARYEQLGIAQADLVQAGLMKNPVLDGYWRWPDRSPRAPNIEVSVTADFIDLLFLPLRRQAASAAMEKTKFDVAAEVFDLATQVRQAYFQLQGAQQMFALRKTILSAQQAEAQTAQRIRAAGNSNQLDADIRQATYESARLDSIESNYELDVDRQKLAALMGMPERAADIRVGQRLPEPAGADEPLDALQNRAMKDRLDLTAARQQVLALAHSLGVVNDTRFLSQLELGINTEREPDARFTGLAFSLPIPLFDFGQASIMRAKHQLHQAEANYAALEQSICSDVRLADAQMRQARLRFERIRDVMLPLQQRIVSESQLHYNGMLLGVFQLLQARQNEIDASRQYVEALRDYWVARSKLSAAVGGRLANPTTRPATQPAAKTPDNSMPGMDMHDMSHMHHHE